MELSKQFLLLYLLCHTSMGNFREVMLTNLDICIYSGELSDSQSFTLVTDLVQCALLHSASDAIFMLVRHAPDGVVECGHTSTLPKPVTCSTGDVTIYADVQRRFVCPVPSVGWIQLAGTLHCVHQALDKGSYDATDAYCSAVGGMLIELETRDDITMLKSFGLTDIFWVGADDLQVQDEYRWKSGGLVDPVLFPPTAVMKSHEHCLVLGTTGLADIACDRIEMVVCAVP